MNTRLKKIRCIRPYNDNGDRIKVELIDEPDSKSLSPSQSFRSDDSLQIDLKVQAHYQGAKITILVEPNILMEGEIVVSSPTNGEKTKTLQKDGASYEITYEVA